ncbi:hypothetical protein [Azospirillum sp.]|uniref:hypothetical protein n=1 Tax=Azospirillum sp. TaxID=34012 RepID=UPI002D6ED541|nr:hypothetical protein [Azospirillum sp.]HYD65725.1 hypothetical protein [Azospirillum sp.]
MTAEVIAFPKAPQNARYMAPLADWKRAFAFFDRSRYLPDASAVIRFAGDLVEALPGVGWTPTVLHLSRFILNHLAWGR